MLSDEVLEKVEERLATRIQDLNIKILKIIGKKIDEIGKLNSSNAYKTMQILKYGGDYEKIIQELTKTTNLNSKDIKEIFKEFAKQEQKYAKQFYDFNNKKFIPYEQNIALKNQVEAISNLTENNIKNMMNPSVIGYGIIDTKTKKIKFKGLRQAYYDLVDEAILSISQGKETFNEAMTRQIKAMGGSGLKVIYSSTYIDKEGEVRLRTRRLDSAMRMNIKDGIRALHNQLQEDFGKQFGANGVEITVHESPAPDHAEMQGRQFSNEEYDKLQRDGIATDYEGKLININTASNFHRPVSQYNCYHRPFSIVLGVSSREYTDKQLQEILDDNNKGFEMNGKHYTTYEGTQMQRRLETEIRKQKDIQIMAKESEQLDTVREAQQKITELTNKYREVSNKAGLPTKMDRMKVSGYRRIKTS